MTAERPILERAITRRQLLQRFGMVGGGSLMLEAMSAWDLMASPAGKKPVLSRTDATANVVVLGGGMSGLITAYELIKLGHTVRILEARDRVGGLAWTVKRGAEHTELGAGGEHQVCEFDEGYYINAGPWRIPNAHHGVIGYCKELGVQLEQYIDDNLVMYTENPEAGALANKKIYLRELRSDLWGYTSELLAKAANQGAIDRILSLEDRERLVQFLVRAGYLTGPDQVYQPDVRMRGTADPYDLSQLLRSPFAQQVRSMQAGTGGPAPVFQPVGGMMEIPLALERAVGSALTKGAEVTSIQQSADNVRVRYTDTRTGAVQEIVADYVVSCLPLVILKKLDVNLSPEVKAAVDSSTAATQAKMGIQMKRRFWEEDEGIYGGHLVYQPYSATGAAPNPIPSFSYPSNDYHSKKGVLLGFYGNANTAGPDGRPLVDLPVRARVEHVLSAASKIHPQIRTEFENAYAVWWPRVKYNEGAWGGNPGDRMSIFSKPDGRIYLGCAATSSDPAWIEGAVEAAWRTYKSLHERVAQAA